LVKTFTLQIYHENIFIWKINIANVSLLGSQKGSNLHQKCARIHLAAGLYPDLLEELKCSSVPRPPSRNEGLTSKGRVDGRWRGKGRGGEGGRRGEGRSSKGLKGKGGPVLNRAA